MEINKFETKQEAAAAAGEALNSLLKQNQNLPVLLMISGGSALALLDYVNSSSLAENLTVTMLDERFTPLEASAKSATVADGNLPLTGLSQDATINNFSQLQRLDFYQLAQEQGVNFIGTMPRPGENMEDMRARWEIALKKWRADNPRGKIFATFGMGADGHIAGIFPYPEDAAFFENNFKNQHWLAGYKAAGKNEYPERITVTFTFLKNIDEAILFVCGEEKRPALEKLIKGDSRPHELPALGLYETKHFQIFSDIKNLEPV